MEILSKVLFKVSNWLAGDLVLHFGKECFCAALWMIVVLLVRYFSYWFYLDKFLPVGLIFASPILIAVIKKRVPLFNMTALLPVRIAEGILGRVNLVKLGVSIPAHFAGCLLGIVAFRNCIPYVPYQVLLPVAYTTSFQTDAAQELTGYSAVLWPFLTLADPRNRSAVGDLVGEAVVVMLYTLTNLILPQILYVNKLPNQLMSLVLLPVMLWRVGGAASSFHPVAQYCLWYLASPESTKLSPTDALLKSFGNASQASEAMASAAAAVSAGSGAAALNILSETFDLAAVTSMENLTELGQNTLSSISSIIAEVNSSISGGSLLADMITSINAAAANTSNVAPVVATLHPLHMLCSLTGGLLAGLICLKFCPDDPVRWKPHISTSLVSGSSNCREPENPLNMKGNVVGTPIVCR
jgi:hypothetical protein